MGLNERLRVLEAAAPVFLADDGGARARIAARIERQVTACLQRGENAADILDDLRRRLADFRARYRQRKAQQ
jgi:hypothetical protein